MKRLIIYMLSFFIVFAACKKDDKTKDQKGNIFGVLETEKGEIIPNSTVTLNQNDEIVKQTITNTDGKFDFKDVPAGIYKLSAYNTVFKNSEAFEYEVKGNTDHDLTFVFYPFVSVSGLVVDAFGTALSGALVTLVEEGSKKTGYTESTITNDIGSFHFYEIVPGVYNIAYITERGREISQLIRVEVDKISNVVLSLGNGGTFVDGRDNKEYKWIEIGNQTWMAENLAYLPQVDKIQDGCEDDGYTGKYYYVYGFTPNVADDESTQVGNAKLTTNYQTYGVLYSWPAAMNGDSPSNSNPSGVQGACPDGWHFPSYGEWYQLRSFVQNDFGNETGVALKTQGNTNDGTGLWYNNPIAEGVDSYSFGALPAGRRESNGSNYNYINNYGFYWTASERNASRSYYMYFRYSYTTLNGANNTIKSYGWSVRCVKDQY